MPRSTSATTNDLAKAADLYLLALTEKDKGNLVAARMNIKLAVTFDPGNAKYRELYTRLDGAASSGSSAPGGASLPPSDPTTNFHPTAKKAYAEARAAEDSGDYDRAIKCYEIALRAGDHAIILSKLGMLLASHKGEYTRAKDLVTRAVILQPDNAELKANKTKLIAEAKGAKSEKRSIPPAATSGFWKMFKRD